MGAQTHSMFLTDSSNEFPFQRVLTAEFIDGCKVSDTEAIRKQGLQLKDVS